MEQKKIINNSYREPKEMEKKQLGYPIHSQVRKIKQEDEKIRDPSTPEPQILRPVLREITRSQSPLGRRPPSVVSVSVGDSETIWWCRNGRISVIGYPCTCTVFFFFPLVCVMMVVHRFVYYTEQEFEFWISSISWFSDGLFESGEDITLSTFLQALVLNRLWVDSFGAFVYFFSWQKLLLGKIESG